MKSEGFFILHSSFFIFLVFAFTTFLASFGSFLFFFLAGLRLVAAFLFFYIIGLDDSQGSPIRYQCSPIVHIGKLGR